MSKSTVKGQGHQGQISSPLKMQYNLIIICSQQKRHAAADGTIPSLPGVMGVYSAAACGLCLVPHLYL